MRKLIVALVAGLSLGLASTASAASGSHWCRGNNEFSVYASRYTSCGFAWNVANAWDMTTPNVGHFRVYSPAAHKRYSVTCYWGDSVYCFVPPLSKSRSWLDFSASG